jgi:hypothetical protein
MVVFDWFEQTFVILLLVLAIVSVSDKVQRNLRKNKPPLMKKEFHHNAYVFLVTITLFTSGKRLPEAKRFHTVKVSNANTNFEYEAIYQVEHSLLDSELEKHIQAAKDWSDNQTGVNETVKHLMDLGYK